MLQIPTATLALGTNEIPGEQKEVEVRTCTVKKNVRNICILYEILLNTLKPRQNCRHFAGDIFKSIFLNENV